ncbi:MAG: carbamoyltransferase HypF [Candidatus Omnitrophica bacterium]|nr:carbamoyltransferase HypF [Candidatus Omnitrophota bacterium]
MKLRLKLHIKGRVQGVGFRPFIYNLAKKHNLCGFVFNDPSGVTVEAEGEKDNLKYFLRSLKELAPKISYVDKIDKEIIPLKSEKIFFIANSYISKDKFVFISPDISICDDCLRELFSYDNRRHLYPFINCTNCGPRYTIIKDIPYDRSRTTMNTFKMCSECFSEYRDVRDRRFHAQPNACFNCGPSMNLVNRNNKLSSHIEREDVEDILIKASELLYRGNILAVKGIGGYHLCCDAKNKEAVRKLREIKNRPTKPFALMVSNIDILKKICFMSKKEIEVVNSIRRPIVILRIKIYKDWMKDIALHQKFLGVMLPYTPLHYLLFFYLRKIMPEPILIMTSANYKDSPLIAKEEEIFKLKEVSYFLIHNRGIYARCDDSISRVYNRKEIILRKARGYIPDFFEFPTKKRILGCGAELKSTFSLTKNNYLITSPYLGDLKNYATYTFFKNTLQHFKKIFSFDAEVVAYDCHPNYLSTQYALGLNDVVKIPIQHHYAHMASCILENRVEEKVIGVIFDGIGFGLDGNVWGGEFFVGDLNNFTRLAYFDYFGLVGGDKAVEEPFRVAFYILYFLFGEDMFKLNIEFIKQFNYEISLPFIYLVRGKHYVYTSSVGRLFDAVSSLLRVKDRVSYEAEAAILLEMLSYKCRERKLNSYPFEIVKERGYYKIKWQNLFKEIVEDLLKGVDKAKIGFKFHYSLATIVRKTCQTIRDAYGIRKVVISGGVFQNFLLFKLVTKFLKDSDFQVYYNCRFPTNDENISVGQVAIANARLGGS